MTPDRAEMWAQIVAARMTGDPMPFDAEVWMPCVKHNVSTADMSEDWQRAFCWAWQQGRYAALNGDGSPRLGGEFIVGALAGITDRYRAAMIAKYRPAEVEENADATQP